MRRLFRFGTLVLMLVAAGACVRPSSWDARTDGGRRPPDPLDTRTAGQPGVEDMRSGNQNSLSFGFCD